MTRAQITLTLVRDDDDAGVDATVEVSGTDAQVQRAMGRLGDVLCRAAIANRQRGPKSVRPAAIVLAGKAAV